MKQCKISIKGNWQRFTANWRKRNWLTDIILYGIQVAAILSAFVMVVEVIDIVRDFCSPHPFRSYEEMTLKGLLLKILGKGWLVGFMACAVVFVCNWRIIRWRADGILWMFILCFGISISALTVEEDMFLYFSASSLGSLVFYFLSLFLPKRIGEANATTFQQCRKPSNWLVTVSFIVLLLWCIMLFYVIDKVIYR